jgi:hypothetical protein
MKTTSNYVASVTVQVASCRFSKRSNEWVMKTPNGSVPEERYAEDDPDIKTAWTSYKARAMKAAGHKTAEEKKAERDAAKAERDAAKAAAKEAKAKEREAKKAEAAEKKAKRNAEKQQKAAERAAIDKENLKLKPDIPAALAKLKGRLPNGSAVNTNA